MTIFGTTLAMTWEPLGRRNSVCAAKHRQDHIHPFDLLHFLLLKHGPQAQVAFGSAKRRHGLRELIDLAHLLGPVVPYLVNSPQSFWGDLVQTLPHRIPRGSRNEIDVARVSPNDSVGIA